MKIERDDNKEVIGVIPENPEEMLFSAWLQSTGEIQHIKGLMEDAQVYIVLGKKLDEFKATMKNCKDVK